LTALWQAPRISSVTVALRGPAGAASAATLRTAVAALDADVPVYETFMLNDLLARDEAPVRVFGTMFVIFGIASLVLAAIGLYAVMAFSVTRRRREMGIRLALGATKLDVMRLIGAQGARQVAIGLGVGFGLGWLIVGGARAILFEVPPHDPASFALVAVVLGGAAALACLVPALRATRVDPVVALRVD
jgi:ABC-type antimicrobial peptide transport system permease subunit